MLDTLSAALIVAPLLGAAWAGVLIVRDRPPDSLLLLWLLVVEAGLLVQAVVGIASVAGTDREIATATFVGYLLGALVVLPAGALWSVSERSRYGTAVLVVACLVVPVVVVRLQQVWAGA